MTGPSAFGWVAVAAGLAISAGVAPVSARVGGLVEAGRLASLPRARAATGRWRAGLAAAAVAPWAAAAVPGAAFMAVAPVGGAALGLAAAAAAGTGWLLGRDLVRGRAAAAQRRALLAAVRVLVGELEAGARASAALSAAADMTPDSADTFDRAAAAAVAAHDAGAVLGDDPNTRPIGLAWQLGEDTGAALAGVLGRVATDLADVDEQRRTVAVALAGPRASAGLLTALPLVGIGLGAAMGARPWEFLFGPPAGRLVCCVGVVLDAAGVFWIRRILSRAERR